VIRAWAVVGVVGLVLGGCDGLHLRYRDPGAGALRLIRNPASDARAAVLDFVVGDAPVTGYAAGFDLALDARKVALGRFTPGQGLDPGAAPIAAGAALPLAGPLAGTLVTALSQKASGAGAVAQDTVLMPGTVLFTVELELIYGAQGVVFDGTAPGFVLRSGGLRNKAGVTVVEARDVAIGALEVR
jgi:hypothetical protein